MIYLDTSVALAHLLAEDREPPERLWQEPLISSRLIEYEIWTRIHARKLLRSHADEARALLGRLALVEMAPPVLIRALEPFPQPVRTLDALHLASMEFLRSQGQSVTLASYDKRLTDCARDPSFFYLQTLVDRFHFTQSRAVISAVADGTKPDCPGLGMTRLSSKETRAVSFIRRSTITIHATLTAVRLTGRLC